MRKVKIGLDLSDAAIRDIYEGRTKFDAGGLLGIFEKIRTALGEEFRGEKSKERKIKKKGKKWWEEVIIELNLPDETVKAIERREIFLYKERISEIFEGIRAALGEEFRKEEHKEGGGR